MLLSVRLGLFLWLLLMLLLGVHLRLLLGLRLCLHLGGRWISILLGGNRKALLGLLLLARIFPVSAVALAATIAPGSDLVAGGLRLCRGSLHLIGRQHFQGDLQGRFLHRLRRNHGLRRNDRLRRNDGLLRSLRRHSLRLNNQQLGRLGLGLLVLSDIGLDLLDPELPLQPAGGPDALHTADAGLLLAACPEAGHELISHIPGDDVVVPLRRLLAHQIPQPGGDLMIQGIFAPDGGLEIAQLTDAFPDENVHLHAQALGIVAVEYNDLVLRGQIGDPVQALGGHVFKIN